ncbi:MAG TPA: SET domain-containing protein-lysine N-methyltransferase [Steroidobacteraceae bacterium]|nr:SET domain-containing protein-lysine N-methyltransferase [Steroidobacteraceae bacterium]
MTSKKSAKKRPASAPAADHEGLPYEVRRSGIHGRGVYATRPIRKGARIVEYVGERISHAEADRRYEEKGDDDGHTFLFVVNQRTVIDATVDGNEARFVNHSCDPNCESVIEGNRVFVYAIRDIRPGEELGYDYSLTWESTDDPDELALYACRCGARKCRGTMLEAEPVDKKRARERARKRARKKAAERRQLKAAGAGRR